MNVPSHLNYDIDGVKNNCQDTNLKNALDILVTDINKLSGALPVCEDGFHGKNKNNVIYQIYDSFSKIIGTSYNNKNNLYSLLQETEDLINSDYTKAVNDRNELDRLIEEERRRQEEERRRQEEERRKAEEEKKQQSATKK
jgi:hypothetical protein